MDETLRRLQGGDPRRCAARRRAGTVATDDAHGARSVRARRRFRKRAGVTRVGVVGATGKMGREVCRAVVLADDLTLDGAVSRTAPGPARRRRPRPPGGRRPALHGHARVAARGPHRGPRRLHQRVLRPRAHRLGDRARRPRRRRHHGVHRSTTRGATRPVGIVVAPELLDRRGADAAVRRRRPRRTWTRPRSSSCTTTARPTRRAGRRWRPRAGSPRRAPGRRAPRPAATTTIPGARGTDVEGVRVHSVRLPGSWPIRRSCSAGSGETLTIRHDTTDRARVHAGGPAGDPRRRVGGRG